MNRLIITIQYTLPASRGAPKAEIPFNFTQKPSIVPKSVLKPSRSHPKSSFLVFFFFSKFGTENGMVVVVGPEINV